MNIIEAFRRKTDTTSTMTNDSPLQSTISSLRELQAKCTAFTARRAELQSQSDGHVAALDLSPEACSRFAAISAGIALSAASEVSLRQAFRRTMNAASTDASRATTAIHALHKKIDEAIRDLTIATLPAEFSGVEITTRETNPISSYIDTAAGAKNVSRIHVSATKWGKVEYAERIDPNNIQMDAYFDRPDATADEMAKKIGEYTKGLIERLAKEQIRATEALSHLQKQLPTAA